MLLHSPVNDKSLNKSLVLAIWVIFFCYALAMALLFQKVVVSLIPSLHAVNGLLPNDAQYFDQVAQALANRISEKGWGAWHIFPAAGATGNVAVLGALYAIFGYDPTLIIPLNAALHASAGLLIFLMAFELSGRNKIGIYAGIIAGSLLVVFPTALTWYGQNHKDVYAITGSLLILYAWVRLLKDNIRWCDWFVWGNTFIGILLIGIVRPYHLKLLLLATIGVFVFLILHTLLSKRSFKYFVRKGIFFFILAAILLIASKGFEKPIEGQKDSISLSHTGESYQNWSAPNWSWKRYEWVPERLDNNVELAAKTRAGFIEFGLKANAKSMIDTGAKPQSIIEVLAYMPRALQIGLFAPFPSTWHENITVIRLVAYAEMLIAYFCMAGVLLLLFFSRSITVWVCVYFSCFFLVINAFVIPNIGTLYRMRFAYIAILMMLGVLGWLTWLSRIGLLEKLRNSFKNPRVLTNAPLELTQLQQKNRKTTITASILVTALTLVSFVGFFIRDVLMVKTFGMGAQVDSFFIVLAIPMFVISFVYMPLGKTLIPHYLGMQQRFTPDLLQAHLSTIFSWVLVSLAVISFAFYFFGAHLIGIFDNSGGGYDIHGLSLQEVLPILFVGGAVIVGNAILNAHHKVFMTTSAQLVTPLAAVLVLMIFGGDYGIAAVVYAMTAGLIVNFIIVWVYAKRVGLPLLRLGKLNIDSELIEFLKQLLPLVLATFFVAVVPLLASFLALSLSEGAVSAFNLGNKIVLFITGLITIVISTSVLPYFSGLINNNNLAVARGELSFFLLVSTLLSIPFTVLFYAFSEQITSFIFSGAQLDEQGINSIAHVMRYSIMQVPFFICSTLLTKFSMATRHVVAIAVIAFIGLLVNIVISMVAMRYFAVGGIAMGVTTSVIFSTLLLLLISVKNLHVRAFDGLVLLMSWLLLITLILCIEARSVFSIGAVLISYVILYFSYFKSISFEHSLAALKGMVRRSG